MLCKEKTQSVHHNYLDMYIAAVDVQISRNSFKKAKCFSFCELLRRWQYVLTDQSERSLKMTGLAAASSNKHTEKETSERRISILILAV